MEWWKQKFVLVKVFLKYMWIMMLQKVYIPIVHTDRNQYEIQYVLNDRIYKVRTRVKRGPPHIIQVKDDDGNDITDDFRCYVGPNEDFHGQHTTPHDIGYNQIIICFRNGLEITYGASDTLSLYKKED